LLQKYVKLNFEDSSKMRLVKRLPEGTLEGIETLFFLQRIAHFKQGPSSVAFSLNYTVDEFLSSILLLLRLRGS
jgi:hypothetical protein